ncbi:MAG: 2-amino-4-hydroxy-6-hydroxymethyldihydropteridine diphosphokinase [Bacteroidota bacterium]
MACTYLLLGSNLGNSLNILKKAIEMISREAGAPKAFSSVYETAPWGDVSGNNFYNCVVLIDTKLEPQALLEVLLRIESELGRVRIENKPEPRTIDIDILLYNDVVINEHGLQVPHPKMHLRRFTLEPMAEVAPGVIHPVIGKSMMQLTEECSDTLQVTKIFDNNIFRN